jgi:hypothetical protein
MADRPQVLIDYMPDVFIMRIGVFILQISENNYILGDLLNVDGFFVRNSVVLGWPLICGV